MLKNKFKIIALFMVIILSLTLPIVRAENETAEQPADQEETSIVNEDSQNENSQTAEETNTEVTADDNFKKGDVYLTGDNVTIDYIVDGNIFVFANTVTINSQIGGDAFIFAGTVNVGEQGYIFSNLFTFAKEVNIYGVVYDLYAASQNTTINGYVYRDIKVGTDTLNINGMIGRNAFVNANTIHFATSSNEETGITSQGIVNGDFNYTSSQETSIPEGSVVGNQNFTETKKANSTSIQSYILSLGRYLVTVAIIWLFLLWIAPKFLNNTNKLIPKKLLPIVAFGILTPIVALITFVILLLLGITSSIAILILTLLFILLAISSAVFVITMNYLICNKLKIEKTIGILGMLIVSAAVLWFITLIPYVGGIISFATAIIGFGILIMSILPDRKKSEK